MNIIQYNKNKHFGKWNAFVANHPDGGIFHLAEWFNIIEKHYSCRNVSLIVEDDGEIRGILPLFLLKSFFFGRVMVPNTIAGYCGILAESGETMNAIVKKAKEIAVKNDVHYLELREKEIIDDAPEINEEHCTQSLRLESDVARQFNALSDKRRNIIRKALSKNMNMEFSNRNPDEFYRIYSHSIKEAGGFAHSRDFFKDVLDVFHEYAEIATAKCGRKTVAVRIDFYFRNTLYSVWAARLRKYHSLSAGDLLVWETMKRCISRGIGIFNFGRSQYGTGVYEYKKWWGAEAIPLYYHYYTKAGSRLPTIGDSKKRYNIALSLWKRTPVLITNFLGPKLIRHIPI